MTPSELIDIYIARLVNQTTVWGKQWVSHDKSRSGYACQSPGMEPYGGRFIYEPVTPDLVNRHFKGLVSCAWVATDVTGCSKWLCFDSDREDGDLDKLEAALRSWGLHVIREGRRPGRPGHLWVLFDQPIKAELLTILSDAMMRLAEVRPVTKDYPHGIERFPKSANGLSQVRAPLGVNLKPEAHGARGWFDGPEHDIRSQLEWLAAQPLNRAEEAIREAEKYRLVKRGVIASPSRRPRHKAGRRFERINVLDYVNYRQVGNTLIAQCPACASEGHDTHKDNLRISADGSKFCCVFGGPGQVHKTGYIIEGLLSSKRPA